MIETGDIKLALFCSVKCPGKLILDAYDACRCLRDIFEDLVKKGVLAPVGSGRGAYYVMPSKQLGNGSSGTEAVI